MFLLQLSDKIDADVDPVGLKVDEIQASTIVGRVQFSSIVD